MWHLGLPLYLEYGMYYLDLLDNPTSNLLAIVTVVTEISQGWDVLYWIVIIPYRNNVSIVEKSAVCLGADSNLLSVTLSTFPKQQSVEARVEALLDTGSLAGDFISEK